MKQEANVLVILLAGFVAYSLPLLIYDTSNLWSTPVPPNDLPPAPPPYPSYHDDDDNSKFRSAVSDGNIASAEAMYLDGLQQDPPVDFVSTEHWHGNTPLFEAARSGHLEMVKWLIAHGAEADKANEWGDSPTNEAAGMGHWDIVWYLADQGANLKRTVEHAHASLVLSAVRHRSTAALAELQRRGVDLNQKAWNNASPLHEAARMGEADIVDWCAHSPRAEPAPRMCVSSHMRRHAASHPLPSRPPILCPCILTSPALERRMCARTLDSHARSALSDSVRWPRVTTYVPPYMPPRVCHLFSSSSVRGMLFSGSSRSRAST
jgi:ankyrin repeat protein